MTDSTAADAEVIADCRIAVECQAALAAAGEGAEQDALIDPPGDAATRITETRATTIAGLRTQAAAVGALLSDGLPGEGRIGLTLTRGALDLLSACKPFVATALLSTALSLAAVRASHAGFFNGNMLLELCSGRDQQACLGYVGGVADAATDESQVGNSLSGWRTCLPKSGTVSQIRDVAVQWLYRHPEKRHLSADSLVAAALAEAFPCK